MGSKDERMSGWAFLMSWLPLMSERTEKKLNDRSRLKQAHMILSTFAKATSPDSIARGQLSIVSQWCMPADITTYQVLFLETDRTPPRPYLIVLFTSSEPGRCKTLLKDQAQTFIPGPLTYRLHCQPSEPLLGESGGTVISNP